MEEHEDKQKDVDGLSTPHQSYVNYLLRSSYPSLFPNLLCLFNHLSSSSTFAAVFIHSDRRIGACCWSCANRIADNWESSGKFWRKFFSSLWIDFTAYTSYQIENNADSTIKLWGEKRRDNMFEESSDFRTIMKPTRMTPSFTFMQ